MPRRRPPWWVLVVLVSCASYVLLSFYLYIWGPETPGFVYHGTPSPVVALQRGLAADRAGLRIGDVVVSINGLTTPAATRELQRSHLGKRYELAIRRDGRPLTVAWTTGRTPRAFWKDPEGLGVLGIVPGVLVSTFLAWFIAFRRPGHATARLGAILFAMSPVGSIQWFHRPDGWFMAILSLPYVVAALPVLAVLLVDSLSPVMVMFYANFPRATIRGRWIWLLISVPALYQLTASVVLWGGMLGPWAPSDMARVLLLRRALILPARLIGIGYGLAAAGALVWNYRTLDDASARRRVRVFVAGFFLALVPVLSEAALRVAVAYGSARASSLLLAYWLSPVSIAVTLLSVAGGLMQAYAILRHRLLDVSVMVRQGLQYAAARGVLLGLAPVFGLMLVADLAWRSDRPMSQAFMERGWLYAGLGAAALVAHARRNVWLSALDRRFFRERYDAQRILSAVLADVRRAHSFAEVAPSVVTHVNNALHPKSVSIALRDPRDQTFRSIASAGAPPPAIPAASKLMALVRVLGKPVELQRSDSGWLRRQLPPEESQWLTASELEWVFPIAVGEERTEVLLVLGPRLSEEPYTRDDQQLLEGIASGLALLHERLTPAISGGPQATGISGLVVPPLPPRYVIRRELGRGGMGTVYEASDTELGRGVAIKLMRPDLVASPEALARFKREARAAASFSHPNVVTVHDVGVADDGRAYLVMELLAGQTVRQALRREGRFTPARATTILRGVCAAVDAAHQRRLLHRDLKPENVFLARTGETEVPKILDFGVAKVLDAGDETALQGDTAPGQLLGTLGYMSPEQLRGLPPAPGWDLWAIGVMAYEMLTGAHPFAGVVRHLADRDARRITPAVEHGGEGSGPLDAFFARALSHDVATRPATAPDFLAGFEAAMAGAGGATSSRV